MGCEGGVGIPVMRKDSQGIIISGIIRYTAKTGSGEESRRLTVFESNLACQDSVTRLCEGKNNGCPLPVLCVVPPPGQHFCAASLSVPVVVLSDDLQLVDWGLQMQPKIELAYHLTQLNHYVPQVLRT